MKQWAAVILSLFAFNAEAAYQPNNGIPQEALAPQIPAGISGLYKIPAFTEVVPQVFIVNGDRGGNPGQVSMDINKDEVVAIQFLPSGQVLMTLNLAHEEQGTVADQLILSVDEFKRMNATMIMLGGASELIENYSPYLETEVAARRGTKTKAKYRKHKVRQEFRRSGRNIVGRNGNCVSVVSYLTGFSGTAGNGVGMANALQRRGWKPIAFKSVRRGSVCSWSGGKGHNYGHVGWFDGRCFQPTYNNCGLPGRGFSRSPIKCVHKN